jgi:hypothetical protein
MQVDTQDRFYNEIHDMSTKNSSANNALFSKERIETLKGGEKLTIIIHQVRILNNIH